MFTQWVVKTARSPTARTAVHALTSLPFGPLDPSPHASAAAASLRSPSARTGHIRSREIVIVLAVVVAAFDVVVEVSNAVVPVVAARVHVAAAAVEAAVVRMSLILLNSSAGASADELSRKSENSFAHAAPTCYRRRREPR